jgi:hypothetical protein
MLFSCCQFQDGHWYLRAVVIADKRSADPQSIPLAVTIGSLHPTNFGM